MHWKTATVVAFTVLYSVSARPGVRTPPAGFLSENQNESERGEERGPPTIPSTSTTSPPTTTQSPVTNVAGEFPLVTNRRIFSPGNVHRTYEKLSPDKPKHDFPSEKETIRMGVAVPLSPEDFEKEINITHTQKLSDSSTEKEGISTWILLSGGGPTKEPNTNPSAYRYEAKIEKIQKVNENPPTRRTTVKPKEKPSTTTTTTAAPVTKVTKPTKSTTTTAIPINLEAKIEKNIASKPKKPSSQNRPTSPSRKPKPKPTALAVSTTPKTTTARSTTLATSTEYLATSGVSSTTPETTTFLILEPKDADFDLPQDRSPGPTTKKPKRNNNKNNKTKKNKNKNEVQKKPNKNPPKEKPLSTKIYNYLAREVMPTVGVGLVGLAVTAGLATYFLGPFGSLRRSYDIADRKDDVYFYNNEEYAGPDGQSEEEVFGKVIAGMPANSPYRNSIKYTVYRNQQNPHNRPNRFDPKYPQPASQYNNRYRNSYGYQGQPPPHVTYNKPKPQESYPPQPYYRYNTDGTAYRANIEDINALLKKADLESDSVNYNTHPIHPASTTFGPSIVTPQTFLENSVSTEVPPEDDNNVLRRRSQFVVGSVDPMDPTAPQAGTDQLTVDSVPEHGPRRRRRETDLANEINDEENEIEGIAPVRVEHYNPSNTEDTSEKSDIPSTTPGINSTPNITDTINATKQNFFDFMRSVFEIKIRMGLNFLQKSTMALQRYLKEVEKKVDESKLFAKRS